MQLSEQGKPEAHRLVIHALEQILHGKTLKYHSPKTQIISHDS